MPVHDWTRVDAGIFHPFHHSWLTYISRALNGGLLPSGYYALPQQITIGPGPDLYNTTNTKPAYWRDVLAGRLEPGGN